MSKLTLKQLLKLEKAEDFQDVKFEEGITLLEELVAQVESGELPLDIAIQSYESGSLLVQHLQSLLGDAQAKLKIEEVN